MDGESGSGGRQRFPEIVGFGALNVDYIASASRLSVRMAEQVPESTARFEWNTEVPLAELAIRKAIERLGASSLDASLGGSAWLTLFTLAQMRLGLGLGCVGVVGRIETPGLSFVRMDLLGDRPALGGTQTYPAVRDLPVLPGRPRTGHAHPPRARTT